MNDNDRHEYVKYRIQTAYKTYEAAKVLADNNFWNSAVNRLYYALFYAVNALLVYDKIHAQTHSGVKNQFSKYYIKNGILDLEYGKLFAKLLDYRQKGDYDNPFDFEEETVISLFDPVIEMIQHIERNIASR